MPLSWEQSTSCLSLKKNEGYEFNRIDTEEVFKAASEDDKKIEEDQTKLTDIFKKALGVEELDVNQQIHQPFIADMRRMQDQGCTA